MKNIASKVSGAIRDVSFSTIGRDSVCDSTVNYVWIIIDMARVNVIKCRINFRK